MSWPLSRGRIAQLRRVLRNDDEYTTALHMTHIDCTRSYISDDEVCVCVSTGHRSSIAQLKQRRVHACNAMLHDAAEGSCETALLHTDALSSCWFVVVDNLQSQRANSCGCASAVVGVLGAHAQW